MIARSAGWIEGARVALDPAHEVTAGTVAGHLQHRGRGVDAGDAVALQRQRAGDLSGAAADVHDGRGRQLGGQAEVEGGVGAVSAPCVVDGDEARVVELLEGRHD